MTPATQAADPAVLPAPPAENAGRGPGSSEAHRQGHIHAPDPGATATLIHDLRELFKVKVVGLVLVTGWGGFYLGSMQSGISSVQRGLLDTLLGIGLVSAGAGALNEALERKTDARMKRTADRPLAAGRFSLAAGHRGRPGRAGARRGLAGAAHQPAHRGPGAAHGLHLRRHLHAAQARHHHGHLHRRISRRHGAPARLDRRPRPHRVAGRGALRHPLCLAVSSLHGHRLALPRRLRPRRHPHVARGPARRLVHRGRGALLRRDHDPSQPGALVAGHGRPDLRRAGRRAGPLLPGLYHPLRRHPARPDERPKAACWRAICSRSASSTCPCFSPRSCSAPRQSTKEAET